MRKLLSLVTFSLLLAACVDTTGLSADSAKTPKGNPEAFVVVEDFADLQCPACAAAHSALNPALLEKYGSQVRFEFRHYPLTQHPYAMALAQASECAADQGKFWEFVDLAFTNQSQASAKAIQEWAGQLELDTALFERCTRSKIKRDLVEADIAEGKERDVRGTPTYYVNGKKTENTLEALSAEIDAQLSGGGQRL